MKKNYTVEETLEGTLDKLIKDCSSLNLSNLAEQGQEEINQFKITSSIFYLIKIDIIFNALGFVDNSSRKNNIPFNNLSLKKASQIEYVERVKDVSDIQLDLLNKIIFQTKYAPVLEKMVQLLANKINSFYRQAASSPSTGTNYLIIIDSLAKILDKNNKKPLADKLLSCKYNYSYPLIRKQEHESSILFDSWYANFSKDIETLFKNIRLECSHSSSQKETIEKKKFKTKPCIKQEKNIENNSSFRVSGSNSCFFKTDSSFLKIPVNSSSCPKRYVQINPIDFKEILYTFISASSKRVMYTQINSICPRMLYQNKKDLVRAFINSALSSEPSLKIEEIPGLAEDPELDSLYKAAVETVRTFSKHGEVNAEAEEEKEEKMQIF